MVWQSGFVYGGSLGSPGVSELRWLKPVRPGDTISVEAEVTALRPSSKGGRGYADVVYTVKTHKGDTVMTMAGVQIMAMRPAAAPPPA
jgi:acyl dehydratase